MVDNSMAQTIEKKQAIGFIIWS